MALPETVSEAGWYAYGSRPGDRRGTSVLAAHVDTRREGLGPFARLRQLPPGARIVLRTTDGRSHTYQARTITSVAKPSMPLEEVFSRTSSPRLVLLTCGGAYDRHTGYRDNVVVVAIPRL